MILRAENTWRSDDETATGVDDLFGAQQATSFLFHSPLRLLFKGKTRGSSES